MSDDADTEIYYGFYSQFAADSGHPTQFYSMPAYPWEVEVSFVTKDPIGRSYKWADKKFLGAVDKCVRQGLTKYDPLTYF